MIRNLFDEKEQKRIEDLILEDKKNPQIISIMHNETGKLITEKAMKTFRKYINKIQADTIAKNREQLENKAVKSLFDAKDQINYLKEEASKLYAEVMYNPEKKEQKFICKFCNKENKVKIDNYDTAIDLLKEMRNQAEALHNMVKRLQEKNFNICYSYTDLSKKLSIQIPQILTSLEQKGAIKILKKRFRELRKKQGYDDKFEEFDECAVSKEEVNEGEIEEEEITA